ncbi:MAG TPA: hypothetical protein VFW98_04380 [Gemmatimonadaceae bacterium]|nr:hypothetical protein [Gemmatimonadaceae bacterium]
MTAAGDDSTTQTQMRHVDFHVTHDIVLGIRYLRGRMANKAGAGPVVFDDKRSFVLTIDTAEVALSMASLGALMNQHVFAYPGSPLRNLHFAVVGHELQQKGVLHKVVNIPFTLTAVPTLTPTGSIRIHPTSMKICDLDGMGLMHALGIKLADLLKVKQGIGVTVSGNDLILDPLRILPPPMIQGHLVAIRVAGGALVQVFGARRAGARRVAALVPPDTTKPNYMFFRSGTLRFGKLFMVHADMQIVDQSPQDPFDFSIDEYNRQLVAGYSKNLPDHGLEVFMPDLDKAPPLAGARTPAKRNR